LPHTGPRNVFLGASAAKRQGEETYAEATPALRLIRLKPY
jgi:hypothetical protein